MVSIATLFTGRGALLDQKADSKNEKQNKARKKADLFWSTNLADDILLGGCALSQPARCKPNW